MYELKRREILLRKIQVNSKSIYFVKVSVCMCVCVCKTGKGKCFSFPVRFSSLFPCRELLTLKLELA